MAHLTLFTSEAPLTKTYWADGKKKNPKFSRGTFEVRDVVEHDELRALIESLTHHQALSYTTPLELTNGTIVTEGNEAEDHRIISRTKKYFNYRSGKGWLFIDHDEVLSEEEVVRRLGELYEPFRTATYVYATSISHGIGMKRGFHLYFQVEDISIVKQAMDNLFKRAFNSGYGFCKVADDGKILNRTFFDNAIYRPAGLDFIAGPICVDFPAPPRDIRVVQKDNDSIDLAPLLAPVDALEAIKVESDKVGGESKVKTKKAADDLGMKVSEYRALRDGGELYPGVKLLKEDGSEIDVAQILKHSMEAYLNDVEIENMPIQHPIEQGLEEKTMLFFNASSGLPAIHSFAHGGQTWRLKDNGSVIEELSRSHSDKPLLIENLKVAHGQKGQADEAYILPLHPDTPAILDLMIKTFQEEYKSERLLIPQWKEMISLFLHLIDGHKGRYSIELPPSHGKTQVICHVILWLYQSKRVVPISLSMFRIVDIAKVKLWLLIRMVKLWNSWTLSEKQKFPYLPSDYLKVKYSLNETSFEELDKAPVIIHTHHVVRRNDFKDRFFTYEGKERHLFIFDEAMFRSLLISEDVKSATHYLNYAITESEMQSVHGLPETWLKTFRDKMTGAFSTLKDIATIKDIIIEMPQLPERYVTSGYNLENTESQNFILKLLNIGATEDAKFIVERGKGSKSGKVLFACKENDIHLLPRVINTDATRSTRMVHQYGSNCLKYPIEPYAEDEGVTYWVASSKKTGKQAVSEDMTLHLLIVYEWLEKIQPKKVLVITSKEIKSLEGRQNYESVKLNHPDIKHIHWGQHKQTNDYKDCDAVIAMNYFRKRGYNYLHDIYGESGRTVPLTPGHVKWVEIGFIIDELIQGFCRGAMREGKRQDCLMFTPYSIDEAEKITTHLKRHIGPKDRVEHFVYDSSISEMDPYYKTEEEKKAQVRKVRSDKKYESTTEKERARSFREECRNKGHQNIEELLEKYLEDKRNDPDNVSPAKWLKANVQRIIV